VDANQGAARRVGRFVGRQSPKGVSPIRTKERVAESGKVQGSRTFWGKAFAQGDLSDVEKRPVEEYLEKIPPSRGSNRRFLRCGRAFLPKSPRLWKGQAAA